MIKLRSPALGVWPLSHWTTREVPGYVLNWISFRSFFFFSVSAFGWLVWKFSLGVWYSRGGEFRERVALETRGRERAFLSTQMNAFPVDVEESFKRGHWQDCTLRNGWPFLVTLSNSYSHWKPPPLCGNTQDWKVFRCFIPVLRQRISSQALDSPQRGRRSASSYKGFAVWRPDGLAQDPVWQLCCGPKRTPE